MTNEYLPFLSKIQSVIKHTEVEYTFRMSYANEVKPGQFFEVSIPKFGEAPISVSGIGEDYVDLTIRRDPTEMGLNWRTTGGRSSWSWPAELVCRRCGG